jgi:hypothetical protein
MSAALLRASTGCVHAPSQDAILKCSHASRALSGLREATASVPQWNDHVGLDVGVVTRRNEFGNANAALKATTQRRASPNDPALRSNAKGEADGSGGAGGQLHTATKMPEKSDYVSQ